MTRSSLFAVAVVALSCEAPKPAAPPAPPRTVPACPGAFRELPESLKEAGGECACPLGEGSGGVWGNGVYTEDSVFCRAAVHAGAVDPAKGGPVKFKGAPGCSRYRGSTQHGVTSASWKAFPKSFTFPGFGDAKCPAPIPDECPTTFAAIPGADTLSTFTCTCDEVESGPVWGSGIYTRDSSICAAAVHAGALEPGGGKTTVRPAPGCSKYLGSTRNGVTSSQWGAYAGSFYFEDYGSAACPEVPADLCPDTFDAIPGAEHVKKFSCSCTADTDGAGAVWGSDVYTRDSSLCRAAQHAGAMGAAGGKITVKPFKGCERYEGGTRNGVTSSSWDAYPEGSFVLEGAPARGCPP